MKRAFVVAIGFLVSGALISATEAKLPPKIEQALLTNYPPAQEHHGLESAHVPPDPGKLNGFVVLERGGVPAERARFVISWEAYDYRGAVVDLKKEEALTTRRGPVYTYLQRGDVLAVAGLKDFNNTIYMKLLTPEIYIPENRRQEKRHSRVTVMLGFKFPKEVIKADDAEAVVKALGEWLKPFSNVEAAQAYAAGIRATPPVAMAPASEEKPAKKTKGKKEAAALPAVQDSPAAVVPETLAPPAVSSTNPEAAPNVEDKEIEDLEKKIDEARRQMEAAEAEMQRIKRSHQKKR